MRAEGRKRWSLDAKKGPKILFHQPSWVTASGYASNRPDAPAAIAPSSRAVIGERPICNRPIIFDCVYGLSRVCGPIITSAFAIALSASGLSISILALSSRTQFRRSQLRKHLFVVSRDPPSICPISFWVTILSPDLDRPFSSSQSSVLASRLEKSNSSASSNFALIQRYLEHTNCTSASENVGSQPSHVTNRSYQSPSICSQPLR